MIIDTLNNSKKYYSVHEKFQQGFEFIEKALKENLALGKYELDGTDLYASISEYDTHEYSAYEAHRKYIDIQYIVSGHEIMYYKPINECTPMRDFDTEKDFCVYEAKNHTVLDVPENSFALFFPEDAHAPGLDFEKTSHVKKIVVKVKVAD